MSNMTFSVTCTRTADANPCPWVVEYKWDDAMEWTIIGRFIDREMAEFFRSARRKTMGPTASIVYRIRKLGGVNEQRD